jgi:hypothetical protein
MSVAVGGPLRCFGILNTLYQERIVARHNARPFNIDWARSIIAQCKAAGVAAFMKQLGAVPILGESDIGLGWPDGTRFGNPRPEKVLNGRCILLRDRKGSDISEWHPDLRVREFPGQERA